MVTFALTFPLNRMVGREFVPNEDMGEWTVHMRRPGRHLARGHTEVAFKLLKEFSGIEGVAQIEPSIGVIRPDAGIADAHPFPVSGPADRRAQEHPGADHHRDAPAAGRAPGYRPSISSRNALGSGEGTGGFAISANILGPDLKQIAEYSKRALAAGRSCPA